MKKNALLGGITCFLLFLSGCGDGSPSPHDSANPPLAGDPASPQPKKPQVVISSPSPTPHAQAIPLPKERDGAPPLPKVVVGPPPPVVLLPPPPLYPPPPLVYGYGIPSLAPPVFFPPPRILPPLPCNNDYGNNTILPETNCPDSPSPCPSPSSRPSPSPSPSPTPYPSPPHTDYGNPSHPVGVQATSENVALPLSPTIMFDLDFETTPLFESDE